MFIRRTKISSSSSGATHYTFRLVASKRVGKKVQQKTLLNLGANFSLPKDLWPQLCSRIDDIITGQLTFDNHQPEEIEPVAQHIAARMIANRSESKEVLKKENIDYQEVDVDSLELVRPRSIGVEHAGLEAIKLLGLPKILEEAGFNKAQRDVAVASIIARMAEPGSESATWQWLNQQSGVGELLGVDFESMSAMRLYRVSDLLVRHRQKIENALFLNVSALFSLTTTITLYDLTNTFFEGAVVDNEIAQRLYSKAKRSGCSLVTMGHILDGSGFVRGSERIGVSPLKQI